MNAVQRVWVNTHPRNISYVDYTFVRDGNEHSTRMMVDPGVGIRLPKTTIRVDKVGHGMQEGRAE